MLDSETSRCIDPLQTQEPPFVHHEECHDEMYRVGADFWWIYVNKILLSGFLETLAMRCEVLQLAI
jgi:hypothetical protein